MSLRVRTHTIFFFFFVGVINGVFMQETFKVASTNDRIMIRQKEKATKLHTKKMKHLFAQADDSGDGILNKDEFLEVMDDPSVKTWLAAMELDAGDPETLWELLDDGDGHLTAEELVKGVGKLKGTAKSIDLVTLLHDFRRVEHRLHVDAGPTTKQQKRGSGTSTMSTAAGGKDSQQSSWQQLRELSPKALQQLKMTDLAVAERAYEAARASTQKTGAWDGLEGVRLCTGIAQVRHQLGNLHGAKSAFEEAKTLREKTSELQTEDGARLLHSLGKVKLELGDLDGALENYEEAKLIREKLDIMDSPEGNILIRSIDNAMNQCGTLHAEALAAVSESRADTNYAV
eukprot:TRINITY_DN29052_c0_g1_i2.p2 TRINITY_DN29052_c0_g1~~TRINITY_DN29052_c0_g1_i2.p2  ORF type:complete len:344 (+),score=84.34 TRINITY_DN29052_c0_g1_i2:1545-2576(+)